MKKQHNDKESFDFGYYIEMRPNQTLEMHLPKLPDLLKKHSFVVLRGDLNSDHDLAIQVVAEALGSPIEYAFGHTLRMKKNPNSVESQFSHKAMALHQDTILNAGEKANYLVFRCIKAPKDIGGETLITNNRKFMKIVGNELKEILVESNIKYQALSNDYYSSSESSYVNQKPLILHPKTGEETIFIGINDESDKNRNFSSYFNGMSLEQSNAIMAEIDTLLRSEGILHEHRWKEGDILICDNFLVCHGRNSFSPSDDRYLSRISVY